MLPSKAAFSNLLQTLEEHAPALRRAGVRSLAIGDITAELAPPEPEVGPRAEAVRDYADPLSDPETYGHAGRVPGFVREDEFLDG